MKNLKSIEIVFENTESITFPASEIEDIYIQGITSIKFFSSYRKEIFERYRAETILLRIKQEANNKKYSSSLKNYGEVDMPFERIMRFNDICSVSLNYTQNKTETYDIVFYSEENQKQKSVIEDNGNIFIKMSSQSNK